MCSRTGVTITGVQRRRRQFLPLSFRRDWCNGRFVCIDDIKITHCYFLHAFSWNSQTVDDPSRYSTGNTMCFGSNFFLSYFDVSLKALSLTGSTTDFIDCGDPYFCSIRDESSFEVRSALRVMHIVLHRRANSNFPKGLRKHL